MPDTTPTPTPAAPFKLRPHGASSPIAPRFIMVKFKDNFPLPDNYEDHLERHLELGRYREWADIAKLAPGATFYRAFRELSRVDILTLSDRAAAASHGEYKPPQFLRNYILVLPAGSPVPRVLDLLRGWKLAIERAYRAPAVSDPMVDATDDPCAQYQWYLDSAPLGINARYAWSHGGDGAQQEFIDIEQGWDLNQPDLGDTGGPRVTLLAGQIVTSSVAHGTAVLGVVCASDNKLLYCGIAPNTSSLNVISHGGYSFNIPQAILIASKKISSGGVILLEVSLAFGEGDLDMPAEVDPLVFEAIQLAFNLGMVVIEAAGNGGRLLDQYTDLMRGPGGGHIFDRNKPAEFLDSGALMVGAGRRTDEQANTPIPWSPRPDSNHGSRINCFAWGDSVETLAADASGRETNFNATSAASAIVAGAALSLQSMAKKATGNRLSAKDVIDYLSDPNLNTPCNPANLVGVMPDLARIGQQHLQLPAPVPAAPAAGNPAENPFG